MRHTFFFCRALFFGATLFSHATLCLRRTFFLAILITGDVHPGRGDWDLNLALYIIIRKSLGHPATTNDAIVTNVAIATNVAITTNVAIAITVVIATSVAIATNVCIRDTPA